MWGVGRGSRKNSVPLAARSVTSRYNGLMSAKDESPGPAIGEMDVDAYLADPARKQRFVTPMFDIIAPRYDRFTRIFSFGMDRQWKNELLAELRRAVSPSDSGVDGGLALDLACGTGDLAFDVAALLPGVRALGIDASPKMIAEAEARRARTRARRVEFTVGDMCALALASASVRVVTAGYGLRNVPDFRVALSEIARVLEPGGVFLALDFYRPRSALWRRLFLGYLTAAGNVVGWAWHREPVVYGYIARSIDHFVSNEEFARALEDAGLRVEKISTKLMGGVAIHLARKAPKSPTS